MFKVGKKLSCAILAGVLLLSTTGTVLAESPDLEGEVVGLCEDETYVASDEEIAWALANGVEGMPSISETLAAEEAEAAAESESESGTITTMSTVDDDYKVDAVYGSDRYETAAEIARSAFPDGVSSGMVILASGSENAWPDSMTATSLAGALDCPIVYTQTSNIPDQTSSVLDELGVESVIVIGQTGSVSDEVVSQLQSSGMTVERLGGADRYETQLRIYEYGADQGIWNTDLGIVVSGRTYADALSISPLAYSEAAPMFLLPTSGTFTTQQRSALLESGITDYIALGGTSTISDESLGYLDGIAAVVSGSYDLSSVQRIGGSTRYETSALVAQWAVSNGYLDWEDAAFASGTSSVDALAGGVLQGSDSSVLLLISESDETALNAASGKGIQSVRVLGGTSTVTPYTRTDIAMVLGFGITDIEGVKIYVDAGHGYNNTGNGVYDSGATSGGYREAELAAELAGMIASRLEAQGVDVFLNDDGGPYYYRHAEARELGCYMIISVHFNAGGGTGSLSLIHSYNASKWSSAVQNVVHPGLIAGVGLSDRGKQTQAVAVLAGTLPAVMLETCFIDNSSDMSTYFSRKETVANEVTAAILKS